MSACEISMEDLKSNEMQNYRFRENCQDFYTPGKIHTVRAPL